MASSDKLEEFLTERRDLIVAGIRRETAGPEAGGEHISA